MANTYNRPNSNSTNRSNGTQARKPSGTQTRKPIHRKKRKTNPDSYLYIFLALMLVAVLVICVLLFVTCGDSSNDESSSDSSAAEVSGESQTTPNTSEGDSSADESKDEIVRNAWKEQDGNKYYCDADGNPVVGKQQIDGATYVFATDGKMLSNCWQTIDGNSYYLLPDGKAAVGEKTINGKSYFFSASGVNFVMANPWNAVCSPENPIDKSIMVRLPKGYGDQQADKGLVHPDCYDALIRMMDDCYKATGRDVYVISGFRTYNYQKNNYENQVQQYLNQGYSRGDAERLAAEWVAVPGTSEHHLGLAVDIIDTQIWDLVEEQEDLEGQQWLMENCWKYGFILRYPKDTKNETGINYEPWHYRYLGEELAKEVHDSGMTLEAYIESIS